ncbi:hypothetical protein S40288_09979 [Stachybotrys chartarum IBT 40288]|nr:hypothetical protein S40288_09979 [Stachybotrys chartarum IBT 40288]
METTSEAAAATVPPEDLIPVTTDHCQQEQLYDNTVRPILDPTTRTGTRFEAFHVPKRDLVVRPLPSTPLKLFQRFLPEQTVQQWVDYTNNPANHPDDRQGQWKPTSYMIYECFCDMKRRIRIDDLDTIVHGIPWPYSQVSEWSDSLKAVSLAAVEVGSHIVVDEAICGFQGHSKQNVTVKNKPTPTGLKIWILATQGYILHWIWHTPGGALGPVGHRRRKKDKDDPYDINPTQAVVVSLVKTLPKQTYHVFLNNLFSSPQLFRQLRLLGVGATGIARTNAGLFEQLVKAKENDRKGQKMWSWGRLQSWPTEDNLINQIGWKDNALVIFLSTVYSRTEAVERLRRRPVSQTPG